MRNGVAGTTATSVVVPGAGWHHLEFTVLVNGSASSSVTVLDGLTVSSLSGTANWGTSPVGRFQIGEVQAGRTYDVVFDDVSVDIPGS